MEFRDDGAEIMGVGLLKNRFTLVIMALSGLGIIGILGLCLFFFGLLPPGRRTAATTAQVTPTRILIALATATDLPADTSVATSTPEATLPAPAPTDTVVVGPTNTPVTVPTSAAPVATAVAPKPVAVVANVPQNPFPGIYVTGMRMEPTYPRKNDPINFYLTFVNVSGKLQTYGVCVEAFRPGDVKSFGSTHCPPQTIRPGTSQLMTGGWVVTGIHACLSVRARAIVREGETRTPFIQPNGADLWLNFQVCP